MVDQQARSVAGGAEVPVVKVLIVDDHETVRWGLTAMLERDPRVSVVGEATDGAEVLDAVARVDPDVVVMAISMPEVDGITATTSVRSCRPDVAVILVSVEVDPPRTAAGLAAGASDCVSKSTLSEELIPAILAARSHRTQEDEGTGQLRPAPREHPRPPGALDA